MSPEAKRLRVTFVVDFEDIDGGLPPSSEMDDDTATLVCEHLLEAIGPAHLWLGGDEPVILEPVGWCVYTDDYGDLRIGTLQHSPGGASSVGKPNVGLPLESQYPESEEPSDER